MKTAIGNLIRSTVNRKKRGAILLAGFLLVLVPSLVFATEDLQTGIPGAASDTATETINTALLNYVSEKKWDNSTRGQAEKSDMSMAKCSVGDGILHDKIATSDNNAEYEGKNVSGPFPVDGRLKGLQIPEPATMLLIGSGLIGAGWVGRRRIRDGSAIPALNRWQGRGAK